MSQCVVKLVSKNEHTVVFVTFVHLSWPRESVDGALPRRSRLMYARSMGPGRNGVKT